MKAVHQDLIRARAYEIWEKDGRALGRDSEYWEQAERELLDAAPEIKVRPPVDSSAKKHTSLSVVRVFGTGSSVI